MGTLEVSGLEGIRFGGYGPCGAVLLFFESPKLMRHDFSSKLTLKLHMVSFKLGLFF